MCYTCYRYEYILLPRKMCQISAVLHCNMNHISFFALSSYEHKALWLQPYFKWSIAS